MLSFLRCAALGAWLTLAGLACTELALANPADAGQSVAPTGDTATATEPAADGAGPVTQTGTPRLSFDQSIAPLELERFVDGVVRDAMESQHIAGASVAIVQDDRLVLVKGYGVAGPGRPMDATRTLVRIGSLSKTFTWIALMKEVEAGRVKLDAPVNDYLPPELQIPDQGFKRPIRVVDLMSHAPGFEDIAAGHLFVYQPEQIISSAEYLARHRPDRVREPGQFATYSNYGVALAGYILSRLNSEDFETIAEREIFTPMGMRSTTFREPFPARPGIPAPMSPELAANLSEGYQWDGSQFRAKNFEFISQVASAGSVSGTAADMARYMRLLLNDGTLEGVRIFGPETAKEFRTQILKVPEGTNGWAHGFMAQLLPGGLHAYGHGGATGLFFTNLMVVPDLRLGIFANVNTAGGRSLVERLPQLLVENFYVAPATTRPGDPKLLESADRYTGNYISTRRAYSGLEKFVGLLESDNSVAVTQEGYLVTRSGKQGQLWVPDGAPGHFVAAQGEQRLVFNLDSNGRAVSYPSPRGTLTLERAGWSLDPGVFSTVAGLTLAVALILWIRMLTHWSCRIQATQWQRRAHALALTAAALWLIALAAALLASDSDPYVWPGVWLLTASTAALLAAIGSAVLIAMTPLVWRRVAGESGWNAWYKSSYTVAALVFICFAVLVGVRGGLRPWM